MDNNDLGKINRDILLDKSDSDLNSIRESLLQIIDNSIIMLSDRLIFALGIETKDSVSTFLKGFSDEIKGILAARLNTLKGKILEVDYDTYITEIEESRVSLLSSIESIYINGSNALFNNLNGVSKERIESLRESIWGSFKDKITGDITNYDRILVNYFVENLERYKKMEESTRRLSA